MRSNRNPIQTAYGPIWGPIQAVYVPIGSRYRLYTFQQGPDARCMRSYKYPIQAAYDPIGTRYRLNTILYEADTGCMRP